MASDCPASGSEIHCTWGKRCRTSRVLSVEAQSMTMCSTHGPCWRTTLRSASSRNSALLKDGVMTERVGTFIAYSSTNHYCPAKISEGHPNPLKISMITHGRSENDFN